MKKFIMAIFLSTLSIGISEVLAGDYRPGKILKDDVIAVQLVKGYIE